VPSGPPLTVVEVARAEARYICQQCGQVALTWSGRCPGCSEWNTLVEARQSRDSAKRSRSPSAAPKPTRLADVETAPMDRLGTGIGELDRVLGGGLVPGSLILLAGAPGIGKSTLTGMALGRLAACGRDVLYVSGEESAAQVRLRAERLGEAALSVPVLTETALEPVLGVLESERPAVAVIDSIQTLHSADMSGAPGSVGQVREAAAALAEVAKRRDIALVLVGHVTKDGSLAGPRVLEHLVDCVLRFEGERERTYRTLRALKNRFGATSEVGVFEMRSGGLTEVADPSARFVEEATRAPGSVVLPAMEGSRPVLVEVQALVAPSELETPRRVATGIDRNRLSLILAVLSRHARLSLSGADVFVNVAGGVRVEEPGADLAVAMAVASAQRRQRPLPRGPAPDPAAPGGEAEEADGIVCCCFGEIGLTGELRYVAHPDRRLGEARKFGLGPVFGPAGGERLEGLAAHPSLVSALRAAFPSPKSSAETGLAEPDQQAKAA
jgi:DNA repair protein RadA/Sms